MHQRPSRCWVCANVSAATSDRRRPQRTSTAIMARVAHTAKCGNVGSVFAWRADSQLPVRTPTHFALFTRAMPAASSGASSSLSAASAANLRIADILTMIDEDPSRPFSSDARHALTVASVNPGRGAYPNQARNSSSATLYIRRVNGEETESSTICFNRSHSAGFSTTAKSLILCLFAPGCWALSVVKSCGHYLGIEARIKRKTAQVFTSKSRALDISKQH